jgi:hypothetical protein
MKEGRTKNLIVRKTEDGIIEISIFEGATLDADEVKNCWNLVQAISNGLPQKILFDGRKNYHVTVSARKAAAEIAPENLQVAVVTDRVLTRVVFRMFAKVQKPKFPIKMFAQYEPAREWLRSN